MTDVRGTAGLRSRGGPYSPGRGSAVRRRAAALVCVPLLALGTVGCAKDGDDAGSDAAVKYPTSTLELMAPAAPGGGWDSTARSLQKALTDSKLVTESVEVYNVPGAGGTLGLSQLRHEEQG